MSTTQTITSFADFSLPQPLLKAIKDLGYETPSPIQEQMIPLVMEGRDVLGQAQTGTGKTAAFALPLIARLNMKQRMVQNLVLAPTRELAIQVAESFQQYAKYIKGFHVVPLFGGQDVKIQLRLLQKPVQVVVGTPGRVMDHMRRGTLKLEALQCLVLDEADEMLRMGFIDDVEWILSKTPESRQVALFSATMPSTIRRIARNYLNNPEEVQIKSKTATATNVNQRYFLTNHHQKIEALGKILEAETFDGVLVFVRTKVDTQQVAEKLAARGFSTAFLNGDIVQSQRLRTVETFKEGKIDILVATDVAARGLDVERISHVINYDIPYDTEAYVHRIGRTARAGRKGDAIMFITPREKRMLSTIERGISTKIKEMKLPSTAVINDKRLAAFKERISSAMTTQDLSFFATLVSEYRDENDLDFRDIAAALACMVQGSAPLLLPDEPIVGFKKKAEQAVGLPAGKMRTTETRSGMERYRIEIGKDHDVKPANIVGAIAGEADLDGSYIGSISIFDSYSTVDLPEGMPQEILDLLQNVQVLGRSLRPSLVGPGEKRAVAGRKKPRKAGHGKIGQKPVTRKRR
ncbi:MAG: DEAD/DEAH box helicase [Proteobacteria bacterium]|nr:DEAD/DEAH box helicase [Pseudomonadota bacterium]MBU1057323.1 DEAD/DEAH box helicase [Pseudomonadota bacterium]